MAITKSIEIPKIEVVNDWNIQVATDTVKANYKTFTESQEV